MPRRRLALAVIAGLSLVGLGRAEDGAEEPGPIVLQTIPLPGIPEELSFGDAPRNLRRLKIGLTDGRWLRLVECASALCAEELPRGPMKSHLPEDGVPGTEMAKGSDPFVEVWLTDGAERAGTGVLPGPRARSISARDRAGRVHRLDMPLDRAIEDVTPRLADLDGDGRDDIVLATAREGEGATLVVVTLRQDGLALLGESAPAPSGVWRDTVAIADLDGDSVPEIATVTSGDDEGRLEIWRLAGGALDRVLGLKGFCTHLSGTRRIGLAAVADIDGDQIADLVLPARDRKSLRVISLKGGQVAEPYRVALPAEVVTRIGAYVIKGRQRAVIVTGLANGTLVLAQ
jgi:hypothetical protein